MTALRIAALMLRPGASESRKRTPIILVAAATFVALVLVTWIVYGTTHEDVTQGGAQVLSVLLTAVLGVPIADVVAASARTSTREREARTAHLGLLGASPLLLRRIVEIETLVITSAGIGLALVLLAVALPFLAVLPLSSGPTGLLELIPPVHAVLVVILPILGIAMLSASGAIAGVAADPLSASRRQRPYRVGRRRLLTAAGVVGVSMLAGTFVSAGLFVLPAMALAIAAFNSVMTIAGPFVIRVVATLALRRARSADRLLAARSALEDPRMTWRQVSGTAVYVTTVLVVLMVLLFLRMLGSQEGMSAEMAAGYPDLELAAVAALAAALLVTTCSSIETQLADLRDRAGLHRALDAMGMPAVVMLRARGRTVLTGAVIAIVGSLLIAGIVAVWTGISVQTLLDPVLSTLTLPMLIAGVVPIVVGTWISARSLDRLLVSAR